MERNRIYKPQYGASYALVIGIDAYKHMSPLSHALNDAKAVAKCLVDQFGFPRGNVKLLKDGGATKASILSAFMSFSAEKIAPDDRIVFFFAGHGHTLSGRRQTGFLIPQDGEIGDLSSLIRWDEFTRNADLIDAKHMLFLMDACYGGLALHRRAAPAGTKRFMGDLLQRYARQVLAAGKPDQPVSDGGGARRGHSIFTSHLLDALEGEAVLPNGLITGNSVMKYVYENVGLDEYSQQTPHFGSFDGDGDFIFNPAAVNEKDAIRDEREGDDVLVDVPAMPDVEPSEVQTLANTIRELIPYSSARIKLDTIVKDTLRSVLTGLGPKKSPATPSQGDAKDQFALRVRHYDELVTDLETIVVLLAHWGDEDQLQLLAKVLTRLAEADRPRAGVTLWLNLMAYPILAIMYAGGIAALAAERYDMLRTCLTTPVHWEGSRSERAVPILIPVIHDITSIFNEFRALPGMAQRYVPRSEHQLAALQPIIEDQLLLGRSYEDLFDQFEIMLALVHGDLRSSGLTQFWGPPGRFAYEERRLLGGRKPFTAFVQSVKAQGQAWPGYAAGFFNGSPARFEEVAQGYAALIATIGPVF